MTMSLKTLPWDAVDHLTSEVAVAAYLDACLEDGDPKLVGAALGALATAITLGVELALLEPWLADLIARRAAEQSIAGAPTTLLVVAGMFVLTLVGVLAMSARLAATLRLPDRNVHLAALDSQRRWSGDRPALDVSQSGSTRIETRSRAAAIADAVSASQRRDEQAFGAASLPQANLTAQTLGSRSTAAASAATTPLGRSYRRRTTGRVSASAAVRDGRA